MIFIKVIRGLFKRRNIMQFDQSDPDYLNGMKNYLSGEWIQAEKIFKELKDKYPESTFIHMLLGNIYYSLGRLNDALISYQKGIKINPNSGIIYYKMGVCAYRAGRIEDALKYFKKVKEKEENSHAMAIYFIALINYFLGNHSESMMYFEKLKKASKESRIANYYLAQIKLNNNEVREAISLLEELIEVTPNFAEIYYLLGNAYYKIHDNIKAIKCIKKALELNPGDKRSKTMLELLIN